jgi:hypothetical protein
MTAWRRRLLNWCEPSGGSGRFGPAPEGNHDAGTAAAEGPATPPTRRRESTVSTSSPTSSPRLTPTAAPNPGRCGFRAGGYSRTLAFGLLLSCAAGLGLATACSDDSTSDAKETASSVASSVKGAVDDATKGAAETVARTIAAKQGAEEFKKAGHELNGSLTCTSSAEDSATEVAINCTGMTKDGKVVKLSGTTSELPGASVSALEGSFTGTVDGQQVFATQKLGG